MGDARVNILSHKYALQIQHQELTEPFKMVVKEVIQEGTGMSLGWIAMPEIQLRQTTMNKQEYIMSNGNPSPQEAVNECLIKMAISKGKEVFCKPDFDEQNNRLW